MLDPRSAERAEQAPDVAPPPSQPRAGLLSLLPGPLPGRQAYALALALAAIEYAVFILAPDFVARSLALTIGWPLLLVMWLGGAGPVLLQAVLVLPAAAYFVFEPRGSFLLSDPSDIPRLILGTLTFLTGAAISGSMHGARRAALVRENEQRESERRFRTLFDHFPDGILVSDMNHRFVMVNPRACQMLGYDADELLALHQQEVLWSEADCEPFQVVGHPAGTTILACERWIRRKDGSRFLAEVSIQPVGEGLTQSIVHDVTERHETLARLQAAEARLRQAEKMEALGRLAGGVAHDFNNMLTVIRGYAELLRASPSGAELDRTSVEEILSTAERARTLTRALLAFSRKQAVEPLRVEPDAVLLTMEAMLGRLLKPKVRLEVQTGGPEAAIWMEPQQLEQVIMNLVVNASDAMADGGTIHVSTSIRAEAGDIGAQYCLMVRDEGSGIDPESLPHVFEPFFTPKPAGHRIGLGLATVYGIVRQQGGDIDVNSVVGEGTTFTVRFPQLAGPPEPYTATTASLAAVRVLVVDDEASIRALSQRVLARAGFAVSMAADVPSAWAILQGSGERPQVVVLDLDLPGLSGLHLARRIHETLPEIRILIVSGMLASFGLDELDVRPEWRLLPKPYLPDALVQAVTELARQPART